MTYSTPKKYESEESNAKTSSFRRQTNFSDRPKSNFLGKKQLSNLHVSMFAGKSPLQDRTFSSSWKKPENPRYRTINEKFTQNENVEGSENVMKKLNELEQIYLNLKNIAEKQQIIIEKLKKDLNE